MLQREVKDPRLGSFISINEVRTSPDLKHARVFVSSFDNGVDKAVVLGSLKTASGFFRSELGRRIRLHFIPELSFNWDDSIERGARLNQLIDMVAEEGHE
jgi:ribosome-binding factor A